ncbi:unnamed protein product [Rotaria sp. Silwood1]|nr:unnamed protein product [Rotaria sp. Silwood1]CAF0749946.1 unnamed protein product [Rotaria sp. Silwood1]CAF3352994.1 unnamed protein product [Rotaria sp. Silwood1]CAF3356921.1 unnamed protein product [Rotaria sp. Silwood1]CAF3357858.1 unnamed protein product [Rotaria sp. Silwood1]
MRLKTLRKERPAFENEGTVISGSRMDLSNSECKPSKHRTNNSFALPTSLNNDLSSLSISISDRANEMDIQASQQTLSRRKFNQPPPSQTTRTSSYQAIEAAYLEHGIRIHLNPTTAAAVTQQQQNQTTTTIGNTTERKSASTIQRNKAFVHRNPSRSSSALHYKATLQESHQDSRPFSELQQTSMTDFAETQIRNVSFVQTTESEQKFTLSEQLENNYCSSSILMSEPSDHIILPTQIPITNDTTSTTTLDNDPDLAYMTSLLQTTNGDAFRDTIRRRAGLRPTLAVHRHPPSTIPTTTTTNTKQQEKSSVINSSPTNHRKSSLRHSMIIAPPPPPSTTTTPSKKKVEKDILKHATRIRASQLKDYFINHDKASRSNLSHHESSVSNSPTRTNHMNKRNKTNKPSKSISLEPLELLLAPAHRPSSLRTSPRVISLSSHAFPAINHSIHQENVKSSKTYTKSPKISFVESNNTTHDEITTTFSLIEHSNSPSLSDENSPLMKTSLLGMIPNNKIRQSNSIDSGCYDQSSSSGDAQSITSLIMNQASSSVPSARLASASTRRSNTSKKVSFEDQCRTVIITTAIFV